MPVEVGAPMFGGGGWGGGRGGADQDFLIWVVLKVRLLSSGFMAWLSGPAPNRVLGP